MKDLTKNINDYYANLLIIQYHNKAKAQATIKLMARFLWANMLFLQIRDAFDWKTAVGKQLEIIGEWVGVNRFYDGQLFDFHPWFALIDWDQALTDRDVISLTDVGTGGKNGSKATDKDVISHTDVGTGDIKGAKGEALPDGDITSPTNVDEGGKNGSRATIVNQPGHTKVGTGDEKLQGGFSTFANFESLEGGFLDYENIRPTQNRLNDQAFRIMIGLKIIKNNITATCKNIDNAIWDYFGGKVYTVWSADELTYYYSPELSEVLEVAKNKNVLPCPTGVRLFLKEIRENA